jgi:hypothetical protein
MPPISRPAHGGIAGIIRAQKNRLEASIAAP